MELKYIIIGAFVVGLLLILFLPSGEPIPQVTDCGTDMYCFVNASQWCLPAKVITGTDGNQMQLEISRMEDNMCLTNMTVVNVNTNATEFSMYPDVVKQSTLSWKGKSMRCIIPLKTTDYNTTSVLDYCDGDLKQAINETLSILDSEMQKITSVNPACIKQTLWDTPDTQYSVVGVEDTLCKIIYSFGTTETGKFTVTHLSNYTTEKLEVAYSPGDQRSENVSDWCTGLGWDYRDTTGSATASASDVIESNGEDFCYVKFILLPASEYLPGAMASVYLDSTNQTAISIQTTNGNTIERVYEV